MLCRKNEFLLFVFRLNYNCNDNSLPSLLSPPIFEKLGALILPGKTMIFGSSNFFFLGHVSRDLQNNLTGGTS